MGQGSGKAMAPCAFCGVPVAKREAVYCSRACRADAMRRPIRERLEANVRVDPSGCHIWTGYVMPNGYGTLQGGRSRGPQLVHRVAYEVYIGPIPEGLHVDHVTERGCTSKACVNPAHLEAVTQQENNRRQEAAGRRSDPRKAAAVAAANRRARTHCRRGHPFDADNTGHRKDGRGRYCRACVRDRRSA